MHSIKYKTQFMTNINLIRVSAPGCHPKGVYQMKDFQGQHANLRIDFHSCCVHFRPSCVGCLLQYCRPLCTIFYHDTLSLYNINKRIQICCEFGRGKCGTRIKTKQQYRIPSQHRASSVTSLEHKHIQ